MPIYGEAFCLKDTQVSIGLEFDIDQKTATYVCMETNKNGSVLTRAIDGTVAVHDAKTLHFTLDSTMRLFIKKAEDSTDGYEIELPVHRRELVCTQRPLSSESDAEQSLQWVCPLLQIPITALIE